MKTYSIIISILLLAHLVFIIYVYLVDRKKKKRDDEDKRNREIYCQKKEYEQRLYGKTVFILENNTEDVIFLQDFLSAIGVSLEYGIDIGGLRFSLDERKIDVFSDFKMYMYNFYQFNRISCKNNCKENKESTQKQSSKN